jgi:glycosyltransferase involved in cell wall biosynthesis
LQVGHQVAFFKSREVAPEKLQPLQEMGLELIPPSPGARIVNAAKKRVSWKLGSLAAPWVASFSGLDKFAPDVIFLTAGGALVPSEFINDLERSGALAFPYVIVCHNSYLFDTPIDTQTQETVARYYLGAQRVLFVAERTYKETEHLLAAKLAHVTIVRNPINLSDTSAMPMPGGSTVRIASLGRLTMRSKGQDVLLAALGSPQLRDRDWSLSIYGEGPHLKNLKILAEHYQIAKRIDFKGHANDVRAIWAEHHLHVLPSRNESAPLVLVEAMLCGRPSVANDVGGVCEWISEPETGFISTGANIESFRSAFERAWSARPDWEAIGQRARAKALQMLDPDPGGTVLKVLLEVAAQRRSGI